MERQLDGLGDVVSRFGRRDLGWLAREALSLFEGAMSVEIEPKAKVRVEN